MKHYKQLLAGVCSIAMLGTAAVQASAAWVYHGLYGDLNFDEAVTVVDVVQMQRYILGGLPLAEEAAYRADLNHDGILNGFDLALLKRAVLTGNFTEIWEEVEETTEEITEESTDAPTEETTEPPTEPLTEGSDAFIDNSIARVNASLPSQGNANLVIFYVDFPDCRYTNDFTAEEIDAIAFGGEDVSNAVYPFESMSAFYNRSSKGVMQLGGRAFRYTTKENQAAYDTDKVKLAEECYEAFKDSVDFSQFDGDGDGMIDATLFTVPTAAGDDNWWPCAGGFGDGNYRVDGMSIGHIITGNAQIESKTDYRNFVSSYLHEMGHCMGLPDYYLYSSDDYEGMHGPAGTELMDTDAASDFGCFSKLMLGWYREPQVSVFDTAAGGTQTFTLQNAQTDGGNCVILPYGELKNGYFSEYMMLEYVTDEANNKHVANDMWWIGMKPGIRVYHIQAELQEDYWFTYLKYQNGSEYCGGDDDGIRLIRLANDAEGGDVFTSGAVIDGSISGFHWYDANENESVDTGYTVTVGDLTDGAYTITVSHH